ncbi:MAG: hypothetical protein VYD54_11255 [Bdellovibrionota bacterium]|nr:hypothetical protein [Bdellovibrionota bacterium]
MKKVLFGILAMMTVLSVQARPGFFLGSVSLTDRKDVDVIHLRSCRTRSNRPVSQIKLKVKKVPAEIDRLKVIFQNGGQQEIYVRDHFKPFSESRWIDLRGQRRCIKKIIVRGDADTWRRTGFRKQAKVLFFGR